MKRFCGTGPIVEAADRCGLGGELSRRGFLVFSAGALASMAALGAARVWGAGAPLVILENPQGLLFADPARCVGCQRCELACTEFNDAVAAPSLSRIKISRNLNFGPAGPSGAPLLGAYGNGLVVQGLCRQCPHPVPCATACPQDAIVEDKATGARVVDEARCVGCRLCQRACPYAMMVFDEGKGKASKCFLCQGRPRCVEACPAQALRYAPWRDLTRESPALAAVSVIPPEKAGACAECHVPARNTPVKERPRSGS
ncbi:4Fe-4S dicluster domain-containing protein [Fundidesulfovibrio magnetotacticus]|uniref:4Fe-4S dicluster domain-containing protein n=1 Tax=Fundidesulfovibrio magnetotacticus TaxID=2730080 RepID=UPI001566EA27|nr:4Fe-4S dicluster domain-containing protein [Fundidesulfovibrio magnetotacticus]